MADAGTSRVPAPPVPTPGLDSAGRMCSVERMGKYLFGTGIIGAVISGFSLLRALREDTFTWRTALAWVNWGITVALAVGAMVDMRRIDQGKPVPADSPAARRLEDGKR